MEYNEKQLEVINSEADKIVCIASAGSGKTSVLLGRIRRLLEQGADPKSMLVLTFTNAAAHEMVERFEKLELGCDTPVFGTFHAFCYSLIVKDSEVRRTLGYAGIPAIATDEDIRRIHMNAKVTCGTKLSDSKLNSSRDKLTFKEQFEFDIFWKQVRKSLISESLITFDIMCYDVCQLFTRHMSCVAQYQEQYKYVCADEFQDTDERQTAFIKSFTNAKLFVCGDPQQMLYRFRGCTNDIIKQLASSPDWTLITLPHNYRSTKQIVDYSNRIFSKAWQGSPYYLQGISDKEGKAVNILGRFPMSIGGSASLFGKMSKQCEENTVAVLCRTNSEVTYITNILQNLNIPFRGKSDNSETAGILRSALSCRNCVEWISSLLPNEEYAKYIKLLVTDPEIMEEYKFLSVFGGRYERVLDKVFDCRRALGNPNIGAGLMEVANILGIKVTSEQVCRYNTVNEGVQYLINRVNTSSEKGIYVGTIHSVKGLEYDIVHLIGVNGKYFPVFKDEDQMACFYVACTRAKSELNIWCEKYETDYDQPDNMFDISMH